MTCRRQESALVELLKGRSLRQRKNFMTNEEWEDRVAKAFAVGLKPGTKNTFTEGFECDAWDAGRNFLIDHSEEENG